MDDREIINKINSINPVAGKVYFSKKQQKWNEKNGKPRFFAIINRKVIEYTEMIDIEMLTDEPLISPLFEDAEFLGNGFFHHRIDQ